MIRLNFWRKLGLFMISLTGLFISVGIPLVFLLHTVYTNIEIETVNKPKITYSFVAAGLIILILLVYAKWIRKIFNRKLDAMAIVNELGAFSSKPVFWNRILKTIEYILPAVVTLLFLTGLKVAFIGYPIFEHLHNLNIYFIILLAVGSIVFLIGDYLKVHFMNRQKIEDDLGSETKKDTLRLKRLKKGNSKEREALLIKQEIQRLQDNLD